jgi:DNA repair ATPase RecN
MITPISTQEDNGLNKKEIINIVVDELVKRNLIKEVKNSFKNTEALLYNYNKLKQSIADSKEEISELKEYGIPTKSKDIIITTNGHSPRMDENEIIERRINNIKQSIARTEAVVNRIDRLLNNLKQNDKYYKVIEFKYFKNIGFEEMLNMSDEKGNPIFTCDVSTLSRNKNRIINELKILLFPDNSIDELGC